MASTGLVKFFNQTAGNGRGQLYWGRADIDGAPFRGDGAPMMTAEEAETRLAKVADPFIRTFDLSRPEDTAAYQEVLDKYANGWAKFLKRDHIQLKFSRPLAGGGYEEDVKIKVYVEWVEFFAEDGKPNPSQRPYIGRPNDD